MKVRISGMINLFGCAVVAGVLAAAAIGFAVGNHLRVGGPVYTQIVLGKDLVADVLPPPAYVIEAYLEATLLLNKDKTVADSEARMKELRKQYNERYEYWRASELPSAIRNKIVLASHGHVERFWQLYEQDLKPAVARNDLIAARKAYETLTQAYGSHRAVIDDVVKDAEAMNAGFEADAAAEAQTSLVWIIGTLLALFALVVGGIVAVQLRVIRPMVRLAPAMRKLAEGDFDVRFSGIGRNDEIGEISGAAETIVQRFGETISVVKRSTAEVTSAALEISSSTTDLSQRTEQQAASIEETTASMAEISETVKKNATNAQEADELAKATSEVASRGGAVVADAVKAMSRIEETSRRIADIIVVIDEIARQTNLLALNAAVEAARAGEAGRGFAVVASEVRSLAQRSSQAAKDIKDLITGSTGQVKEGVELVNRAGTALEEITSSIHKVQQVVADIATASAEQATGIEEIGRALEQMDEVTQQNSALVEESAATAKTLEEQVKSMSADRRIAAFKPRSSDGAQANAAEPPAPAVVASPAPRQAKARTADEGPARTMHRPG